MIEMFAYKELCNKNKSDFLSLIEYAWTLLTLLKIKWIYREKLYIKVPIFFKCVAVWRNWPYLASVNFSVQDKTWVKISCFGFLTSNATYISQDYLKSHEAS